MTIHYRFLCTSVLLLLLTSLVACSSKKEIPAPVRMKWTVDGSTEVANASYSTVNATDIELIGGLTSATMSHKVTLYVPKRVGTFPLSNSSAAQAGFSGGALYMATNGSITVSRLTSTNIAGTFSFVGTSIKNSDTKAITNGTFNMDL